MGEGWPEEVQAGRPDREEEGEEEAGNGGQSTEEVMIRVDNS